MRYLLVAISIILLVACNKNEITSVNNMDYIVYSKELKCRPVSTNNGFYAIVVEDSLPYFTHFDITGEGTNLLGLSSYFSGEVTIDSVENISLSQLNNENMVISFTYTDTLENTNVCAVEVTQQGNVADKFTWSLETDTISSSFLSINKTADDSWMIISSGQSQTDGFQPSVSSTIYLKIIQVEGVSLLSSSLHSYEAVSVDNAFALANNSIVVSFSQNQFGDPGETPGGITSYISKLAIIYSPDEVNEKELSDSITEISVLAYHDNAFDLLGLNSSNDMGGEAYFVYLQYSSNLEKITSFKQINEYKFSPTCMHFIDDQIITGGYSGEVREFSWTDLYSSDNTSTVICAISTEGEISWIRQNTTGYSEILAGVTSYSDELLWLYSKKSFSLYKTSVVSKTGLTGNKN